MSILFLNKISLGEMTDNDTNIPRWSDRCDGPIDAINLFLSNELNQILSEAFPCKVFYKVIFDSFHHDQRIQILNNVTKFKGWVSQTYP